MEQNMFIIFNLTHNLSLRFPLTFLISLEFLAKWNETSFVLIVSCLWMSCINENSLFIFVPRACPLSWLDIFFYINFIEVQLIYNVVLISTIQQSDSVVHIYTFFFIFFSIMVYHRILNIVPCRNYTVQIQQDLVVYQQRPNTAKNK